MANAKDVMENGKPTWLKCCLNFDSLLIVKKKKIPGHLAEAPILDKVVSLRDALLCFEDAGEAGPGFHAINPSTRFNISQDCR